MNQKNYEEEIKEKRKSEMRERQIKYSNIQKDYKHLRVFELIKGMKKLQGATFVKSYRTLMFNCEQNNDFKS